MYKLIPSLVHDDGMIEAYEQLKSYITNYYKDLFGAPEEGNLSMDKYKTDDIHMISDEDNSLLTAPYIEDEVRKTVFQTRKQQSPSS
jgi:hypothetical protein